MTVYRKSGKIDATLQGGYVNCHIILDFQYNV